MLIYIIFILIIFIFGFFGKTNNSKMNKKIFLFVSFGIMTILSSLRKYTVGIDLNDHYFKNFSVIANIDLTNLSNQYYEIGYTIFNKLLSFITTDPQILVVATSFIIYPIFGWFIYKNSNHVFQSTIIFICYNMFFQYMNVIRQAIAIAILLIAVEEGIKKNKKIVFILIVLLASTFHGTAILGLILLPLSKIPFYRSYIFVSVFVTLAMSILYEQLVNVFSIFANSQKDYTLYIYEKNVSGYGTTGKICMLITSIMFLLAYFILIFNRKCRDNNEKNNSSIDIENSKLSVDLQMFGILFVMALTIFGNKLAVAERLGYYFLPFLIVGIPNCIDYIKTSKNKLAFIACINFIFVSYFSYTLFTGGAQKLFGVVPYLFFWE